MTPWLQARAERTERIVTLILMGRDIKAIAHQFGLTYQAVWWLGRQYGMRRITDRKQEQARRWLRRHEQGGISWAEIARSDGIPATTVRSAVERLREAAT